MWHIVECGKWLPGWLYFVWLIYQLIIKWCAIGFVNYCEVCLLFVLMPDMCCDMYWMACCSWVNVISCAMKTICWILLWRLPCNKKCWKRLAIWICMVGSCYMFVDGYCRLICIVLWKFVVCCFVLICKVNSVALSLLMWVKAIQYMKADLCSS